MIRGSFGNSGGMGRGVGDVVTYVRECLRDWMGTSSSLDSVCLVRSVLPAQQHTHHLLHVPGFSRAQFQRRRACSAQRETRVMFNLQVHGST